MNIRKFRPEDAESIYQIVKKNLHEHNSKHYRKAVIKAIEKALVPDKLIRNAEKGTYLIAEDKGRLLGIAGLEKAEIKTVFVEPKSHKKGIGKMLMHELEKLAKEKKLKKITLNSSIYAEGFYRSLGFKSFGRQEEYIDGLCYDIIRFDKRL